MTASDLVALATDPKAFDRMIAELVRVRESAHDRERQAVAGEKALEESEKALAVARERHKTGVHILSESDNKKSPAAEDGASFRYVKKGEMEL